MAAGMFPLGGGTPNPRPNLRDFSTPASAWVYPINERNIINQGAWDKLVGDRSASVSLADLAAAGKPTILHTPSRQTEAQRQAFNTAESNWARIEAARKKRQEAYEAMAQKTGPTPKGVDVGQYKEAGDPFSPVQAAGGQAPAYESALFGQPRKRRERYRSIVNLRNP